MATAPLTQEYPWYTIASGGELEQGDILEACPVFVPPDELANHSVEPESQIPFPCQHTDVIVMSQTCDLVKGREKLEDVLLCAVWLRTDLKDDNTFSHVEHWENARRGRFPAYHVLGKCEIEEHDRDVRLVDFRRLYSLPLSFVRTRAEAASRIRLMPPYREHLSQAFARYFMRVGLPADIPQFKK